MKPTIPEWAKHCHSLDDYEYSCLLQQAEEEDCPWPEWVYVCICLFAVGCVVVASCVA
jgi:hypothetical protein